MRRVASRLRRHAHQRGPAHRLAREPDRRARGIAERHAPDRAPPAFGLYDHGMAGLLQRLNLQGPQRAAPGRQRYWRVHAKQALLTTGAIEQPLVFERNDLPGIDAGRRSAPVCEPLRRGRRASASCSRPTTIPPISRRSTSRWQASRFPLVARQPPRAAAGARRGAARARRRGPDGQHRAEGARPTVAVRRHVVRAGTAARAKSPATRSACRPAGQPAIHLLFACAWRAPLRPGAAHCFLPRDPMPPLACAGARSPAARRSRRRSPMRPGRPISCSPTPAFRQDALVRPAVVEEPLVSAAADGLRRTTSGKHARQWLDLPARRDRGGHRARARGRL